MTDGPYRDLVAVVVYDILERAYGIRPPLSFRRLRSASAAAAAADASDLNPETAAVSVSVAEAAGTDAAVVIREDFVEYLRIGGDYGGAAERASLIGDDPRVDAVGVERVTADWQQPELIMGLELRQAHGAVASGEVSGDRAERKERERIQQTSRRRRLPLLLASVLTGRLSPEHDVVGGREGVADAPREEAEEEINRGGDYDCRSDNNNNNNNGRRRDVGGRRRRRRSVGIGRRKLWHLSNDGGTAVEDGGRLRGHLGEREAGWRIFRERK